MTETPLAHLIAEAINLAGGNTCAAGHDWVSDGGRACPHDAQTCSQAAYRCARCGAWDYGDPGGPGYEDCADGGCSPEAHRIVLEARRTRQPPPAAAQPQEREDPQAR